MKAANKQLARKARNSKKRGAMDIEDSSSDEEYEKFNSNSVNYKRKSMPWLYPDYQNNRDKDRQPLKFQIKRHLIYPNAPMTDKMIKLPEKKEEIFANPKKILICAPSNAAIDQIVRLVINKGLFNEEGGKFSPSIVRVGPNFHKDLKAVSLE